MAVNFTQLFQESWNFLRNQRKFTFSYTGVLILVSLGLTLLQNAIAPPVQHTQGMTSEEQMLALAEQMNTTEMVTLTIAKLLITLFVLYWGLMSIHQISQQRFKGLGSSAQETASRFLGIIGLSIIVFLPITIGFFGSATALIATLMKQPEQVPSIFALFLLLSGIFCLVRLCLAPLSYLVGHNDFKSAVPNTLKLGTGRSSLLFLYCLINYIFFPIIAVQISALAQNEFFMIFAIALIAFINLFSTIFTYRFYSVFSQK